MSVEDALDFFRAKVLVLPVQVDEGGSWRLKMNRRSGLNWSIDKDLPEELHDFLIERAEAAILREIGCPLPCEGDERKLEKARAIFKAEQMAMLRDYGLGPFRVPVVV